MSEEIQFYVPEGCVPSFDKFKDWLTPSGEASQENNTLQNWNYQTWYHLDQAGFNCSRMDGIPRDGILLSTWAPELNMLWNRPDVFLIGIASDGQAWPSARMTVVQNPRTQDVGRGCHFIPHWPQPGIIPREQGRGAMIQNLHYFGVPGNLAREFHDPGFASHLMEETGVKFALQPPEKWHDFSQSDLVLAVRGLDGANYDEKPATKLYNAWIAGVPAICGTESSMLECCYEPDDACFVKSVEDVIEFVRRIRREPDTYFKMVSRAHQRGEEYGVAATTERWKEFLLEIARPAYHEWRKQARSRRAAWLAVRHGTWMMQRAFNKLIGR